MRVLQIRLRMGPFGVRAVSDLRKRSRELSRCSLHRFGNAVSQPETDPMRTARRPKMAGCQIRPPVAIEISGCERQVAAGTALDFVRPEFLPRELFQPHQRLDLSIRLPVDDARGKVRRTGNVQIPITVEIDSDGAAHAWKPGDLVVRKREPATILEPVHSVIGFKILGVQAVAIGVDDIQVPVCVQVDHLDSTRSK